MADDLDLFARQAQAAREFEHRIEEGGEGRTFTLRLPTPGQQRLIAGEFMVGNKIPDANLAAFNRKLAEAVIVGWRGVKLGDLYGSDTTPLGYSTAALRMLLEYRTDWQDELLEQAILEKRRRDTALEADRKNSRSGSPGSTTSGRRAASSRQSG